MSAGTTAIVAATSAASITAIATACTAVGNSVARTDLLLQQCLL